MRISQVDAFASKPFSGNPAAVCVLPEPRPDGWMQDLAREMNLSSETAFLRARPTDGFDLRWFTPAVEVDLCGHATLASAHVLWEKGFLSRSTPVRFHTRSGLLTATARGEWIEIDLPAEAQQSADPPAGLIEALGVEPTYLGRNRFDYLVEIRSEAGVRALAPDFHRLGAIETRGVIVTARTSGDACDFVSRFFAPAVGVDEDPVTGSAHCCLGPYWQKRLGQDTFTAFQASARGGVVRVQVVGDRVRLGGQAITVFTADLDEKCSGH